jgi:hypothetical protein
LSLKDKALLSETDATTNLNVAEDCLDWIDLLTLRAHTPTMRRCCLKLLSWKWRAHAPSMWRRCLKLLLMN